MSANNNDSNNQTADKKRVVSTPSIGDAVKEAIETGKEVVMQGPTDTEDFDDIKDILSNTAQLNDSSSKDIDTGIALSVDESDASKLEINVKDSLEENELVEDKIVVNPQKEKETTIETITTIPAEEGIDVEVKTEVEVPVEDENENVESDLKVVVHSPQLTTEVPVDQDSLQSSSSLSQSSQPSLKNDDRLTLYNKQENKETKEAAGRYLEFQNQSLNSFQSSFFEFIKNTSNAFWSGQAYCTNLQEIYSKMAMLYAENTIALTKMFNDIAVANADAFKNFFNISKTY